MNLPFTSNQIQDLHEIAQANEIETINSVTEKLTDLLLLAAKLSQKLKK